MRNALSNTPNDQNFRPGPPRPSVVMRPGIGALAPGEERYTVAGGGAIAVPIPAGDRVRVVDLEGMQRCEILAADSSGAIDPVILGSRGDSDASGLKQILSTDGESARAVRSGLERRGIDLSKARAVTLFGGDSRAGDSGEFTVSRDGLLIVAAPGEPMEAGAQDTATPIRVHILHSRIHRANEAILPEPLADPLQDIRVHKATAGAYFVRAGEYIQIIDVAGRQCTDFQCFSARKLDKGIEHPLDVTTTRSLVVQSYPLPGLFSKSFDQDMEPLVEMVRDTVGRHDAFGLACYARYYADQGYPGHVNCTDNFNVALAPYSIAPRTGWMALNLFYNTGIDAHNVLYFDEPWSRPGDYVMLRALTDIVCVSSACPSDIDPANGWDPTDIHVRTYSDKQSFSRAVAYRMTPDAEPELTRETAFHPRFSALTRNYTEYRGYWLPTRFSNDGPVAEYWACRERAAIMDLSPLRKFEVTGPDAESLLQYALTRNVRKLAVGQVVYTAMCYDHGGMIDDGTLFRIGENQFRWIGGDDYGGVWLREQAEKLGLKAWVRSSTEQLHNVAVQGPKSRDILREVVWTPPVQPSLDELGWFRFTIGRIGGFEGAPVVVSRTGYSVELVYDIFCRPKDGLTVFDAIWQAGEPHGLMPLGLQALDMVRIEAGLAFAGYEFCDQTDPFEAGIGFTVALKGKNEDFIGREALIRRSEHPQKKLVGLELEGDEPVGHGDCIHIGRAQIGVITSATRSPILNKTLALARLDLTHAGVGTAVQRPP